MNCQWSLLTCQINLFSFSSAPIGPVHSYSRKANTSSTKAGGHTLRVSSHFATASKPTFQKVTGSNLILASSIYKHETESNHTLFSMLAPTFLVNPPALLTCLPWEKLARTNPTTSMQGNLQLTEYWQAKKWWLMFHMISLLLLWWHRCKTQLKAYKNPMFHALVLNCRFTEHCHKGGVKWRKEHSLWWVDGLSFCRPQVSSLHV